MFRFLGIGAQKSGTTWLYAMLARHPDVDFPGPRAHAFWNQNANPGVAPPGPKEQHFWDLGPVDDPAAVARYLAQFDDPARCQGELTPAYALLPPTRVARIRSVAPDLRLIYLIRNPIERAWSSALMALGRSEMTIDEASDQWFLDHFRSAGSLARGDYETTLSTWRAVFPSEQVLVERYDDIAAEPRSVLRRVAAHLGIAIEPLDALPEQVVRERIFPGAGLELRPSLREALRAMYGRRIASLSDYLGQPLPWG